jgi:TM2 domain-containing membrane protein YozV
VTFVFQKYYFITLLKKIKKMRKLTLLFMLMAFCLSTSLSFAATMATVNNSTLSTTISNLPTEKKTVIEKFVTKAEKKITKLVNLLPIKKAEDSKLIIAILLGLFLGGIGIHRVYLGGKPVLILFYLLLNILFGLGAILALIDIIVMAINGSTSKFDGNDKLFAAF